MSLVPALWTFGSLRSWQIAELGNRVDWKSLELVNSAKFVSTQGCIQEVTSLVHKAPIAPLLSVNATVRLNPQVKCCDAQSTI